MCPFHALSVALRDKCNQICSICSRHGSCIMSAPFFFRLPRFPSVSLSAAALLKTCRAVRGVSPRRALAGHNAGAPRTRCRLTSAPGRAGHAMLTIHGFRVAWLWALGPWGHGFRVAWLWALGPWGLGALGSWDLDLLLWGSGVSGSVASRVPWLGFLSPLV